MNRALYELFGEAVRGRRVELGLSQTRLAELLDVSRQNLAEIEAGRRMPQLSLAARLAAALGWSLDRLAGYLPQAPGACGVRWVLGGRPRVSVPVVWTILDGELAVAEAGRAAPDFACDGFLDPNEGWVQEVYGGRDPAATLFVAGCDPFLKWVWRRTPHPDLELYIFPMGSQPAIEALSQREVHIAGTHLFDPVSRSYNGQVQHLPFATRRWQYTYWESGRMGAMGETEGWALREVGSEARAAYERQFDPEWRMHVHTRSVELDSHWAIGRYLRNHPGFAGVGIRPVAEALGIPFTLWSQEPYEWVTRAEWADDPRVSAFEHWLQSPAVGSLLESLPGLTAWQPGTRIR